ncbi:MAG: hypothetical protein KGZ93_04680 [Actinobacteria bacterium]|nr:hypothetical protein [Actinomycetota bacterium]
MGKPEPEPNKTVRSLSRHEAYNDGNMAKQLRQTMSARLYYDVIAGDEIVLRF